MGVNLGPLADIWPLLLPLAALALALTVSAIVSFCKKALPFSEKWVWLVVILVSTPLGPIIYFALGSKMLDEKIAKKEGDGDGSDQN